MICSLSLLNLRSLLCKPTFHRLHHRITVYNSIFLESEKYWSIRVLNADSLIIEKIIAFKPENFTKANLSKKRLVGQDPWVINNFVKYSENFQKIDNADCIGNNKTRSRSILGDAAISVAKIMEKVGTLTSVLTMSTIRNSAAFAFKDKI